MYTRRAYSFDTPIFIKNEAEMIIKLLLPSIIWNWRNSFSFVCVCARLCAYCADKIELKRCARETRKVEKETKNKE